MRARGPLAALAAGAFAALALMACGGGGGSSSGATSGSLDSGPVPAPIAARAEANCRDLVARTKRLTNGVLLRYGSVLEARTKGIARPGLPLVQGIARRQQALSAQTDNQTFKRYTSLFDPLIVIGQQLLAAGLAQDLQRSRNLEGLLAGIGVEQKQAARAAGLHACVIDFPHLVLQSALR
jgi:hypothetical protein